MSKDIVKAQDVQEVLGETKIEEAVTKADFDKAIKSVGASVKKLNKDVEALWRLSKKVTEDDLDDTQLKALAKKVNEFATSVDNNARDPLSSMVVTFEDIISARL